MLSKWSQEQTNILLYIKCYPQSLPFSIWLNKEGKWDEMGRSEKRSPLVQFHYGDEYNFPNEIDYMTKASWKFLQRKTIISIWKSSQSEVGNAH